MKSPTDELFDLCPGLDAEPRRTGFSDGLDLYDELISFVAPSPDEQPQAGTPDETVAPPPNPPADSGALSTSGEVIRITGALAGFNASRPTMAAVSVCGDCGNRSEGDEMFCIHCGGLLDAAAASAEAALALAGLCDECGSMIEDDEIFCPSCGSVMATG